MPSAGPPTRSSRTATRWGRPAWPPWPGSSRAWPGPAAWRAPPSGSSRWSAVTRPLPTRWGSCGVTSPRSSPPGELLVVDDNRVYRLLLGRALEQLGHTVTFAENGREALETLRKARVDLVLLDIEMPEMDGYQVLEALGADTQLREIPVVMMSSLEEVDS